MSKQKESKSSLEILIITFNSILSDLDEMEEAYYRAIHGMDTIQDFIPEIEIDMIRIKEQLHHYVRGKILEDFHKALEESQDVLLNCNDDAFPTLMRESYSLIQEAVEFASLYGKDQSLEVIRSLVIEAKEIVSELASNKER